MVGNSPVPTMDELPFKIVKMLGARDEVIARREFVDLPRRRHGISHHWIAGASLSGNANDALLPVLVVILQQVCKTFLVHRQFNTFLTLAEISLNSLTNNEGKDHASAIHYDRNAIGSGGNVGDHECR